ncbi:MAG: molybdenum cofactor guanylyltransferase [Firmicutes bacterium]|nr:molybdenum cofactor guanylyltransferase [Bacillota bacterium]
MKFNSAVILAGGKSSRMGFDKQLIRINQQRVIDIIISKLNKEFKEVIIVTNKPKYYKNYENVLTDEIKKKGPLSGIHIGLKKAKSEYVYFTACDMPNVNTSYIRYMKEKIREIKVDACVTNYKDWIEPFNSFYNKGLITSIEQRLRNDERSIYTFLKNRDCFFIEEEEARKFSPTWDMFLNLNTKGDLQKYIRENRG